MIEELSDMPFTKNDTQQIEANHAVSIGEFLRSKREEKGLCLENMSFRTKIHIGLLTRLENNELTKLPNKIYVRGFVSSAAEILGINRAEALDILESTYNPNNKSIKKEVNNLGIKKENARNTLTLITSTPCDPKKSVSVFSNTLLAKIVVGILIVGAIGFYVKYFIEHSAKIV